MSHAHPASYLESKVFTASPPRLHLMLIEGACRFTRKAEQEIMAGDADLAQASMMRAIEILEEMLAGVRHCEDEVNQNLAELYRYLFYTLTSAYLHNDAEKLKDVLRVLEFERETWQLACERVTVQEHGTPDSASPPVIAPLLPSGVVGGGLSIEA